MCEVYTGGANADGPGERQISDLLNGKKRRIKAAKQHIAQLQLCQVGESCTMYAE